MKKHIAGKIKSSVCLLLCAGIAVQGTSVLPVTASTISEIEQQQNENQETINELEAQKNQNVADIEKLQSEIDELKSDIEQKEQYQKTLTDKILLQEDNIRIIKQQVTELEKTISETEAGIAELENAVKVKEAEFSKGMDEFKLRLKTMYIAGNDSVASVLVGSSDFYDMLAKMELVNRIANYDKNLLDKLTGQVRSLNESKAELEADKKTLDESLASYQKTQAEYQSAYDTLCEDYKQTDYVIELLRQSQQNYTDNVTKMEIKQSDIDKQIAGLEDEIEKQAQEIRKKQLEERRRQEEERRKQNAANQSGQTTGTSYYTPTYDYVYSGDQFLWPVPGSYYISSGFGYRWGSLHGGVDIAGVNIKGRNIVAASDGVVILASQTCTHNYPGYCNCGQTYGNYVIIDHGDGTDGTNYKTLYGHMTSVNVTAGQVVKEGDVIGTVGCTGYSTGPHLHFEIRVNGTRVNPMGFYN